jgi:transposase
MYQCYVYDDNGEWDDRSWFRIHDITHENFWGIVEEIVDKHHKTPLPF